MEEREREVGHERDGMILVRRLWGSERARAIGHVGENEGGFDWEQREREGGARGRGNNVTNLKYSEIPRNKK